MDTYLAQFEEYLQKVEYKFTKTQPDALETIKRLGLRAGNRYLAVSDWPEMPQGPYHSGSPGCLWDSMFDRIVPYGVNGMIWYQGEGNGTELDYIDKYLTFLDCVRDEFLKPDLPVYAVELASFTNWWEPNDIGSFETGRFVTKDNWAFLREQQRRATVVGKNNYLVTTQQIGDLYDIHPTNKKELARRLAKKALRYTFGWDILADEPTYRSVEFKDGKAYIQLNHAQGLFASDIPAIHIMIADDSKVLKKAEMIIDGEQLIVYHKDVKNPSIVRYGFDNFYDGCHIYNEAGLPLAPFRTDSDIL